MRTPTPSMPMAIPHLRAALPAAALALLAACGKDPEIVLAPTPPTSVNAAFMQRYAAIGNSITAGFQSGGISAATQVAAYPTLLARAAGVQATFVTPTLTGAGCAPLTDAVSAFRGAAMDPSLRTSTTCVRTSFSPYLNNVAVPGADAGSPTGAANGSYNPLATLILGGRTQVQRALEIDPTFVSVWIGNNDVLFDAINGDTTGVTPLATFQQGYDAMIAELTAGTSGGARKGVLIGVVDVANVPALLPVSALLANTNGLRSFIEQAFLGGRPLLFVNCPATTTSRTSLGYFLAAAASVAQLPAGSPVPFACSPTPVSPTLTLGTAGVLDQAEATMVSTRVAAFNAYIQQKANAIGWAYWDPNPLLATLRTQGEVLASPVFVGPTAATAPYGAAISLDGIHPSSLAHVGVANALTSVINNKYGSSLPATRAP